MDEDLSYLPKAMFNILHKLVENSQCNCLKEENLGDCPRMTKCNVQEGILLLILQRCYHLLYKP